jgi:hypothetical protein
MASLGKDRIRDSSVPYHQHYLHALDAALRRFRALQQLCGESVAVYIRLMKQPVRSIYVDQSLVRKKWALILNDYLPVHYVNIFGPFIGR